MQKLTTSTTHLVQEYTEQQWFEKFCIGDKTLEDEERSSEPLEVENN